LIDLKEQYQAIRAEVMDAVEGVFDSQGFILGPTVEGFESDLARYMALETGGVVGVSSGTDALLVTLMALGVRPGDRVLTTPFSFFATAGVIARLGATPEFVDIDPVTFNLDPQQLVGVDPTRYAAMIVVHVFGRTAEMKSICRWAEAGDLPVVEDAAQAIGAIDEEGRPAGQLGIAGCFSFFPTKNLGGAGDAGAVVTTDDDLLERLRLLRVHGAATAYDNRVIGGNFRLDALQAAVLQVKLRHLNGWNRLRLQNAARYGEGLSANGSAEHIQLPDVSLNGTYTAHQYVLRTSRRDELAAHLRNQDIGCAVYYPRPFHLMEAFSDLDLSVGAFPAAEAACEEVLALPIFPELGRERQDRVIDAIGDFFS
jgi:dTDP-4-amino-4,6-dideoxygalactose transaminase